VLQVSLTSSLDRECGASLYVVLFAVILNWCKYTRDMQLLWSYRAVFKQQQQQQPHVLRHYQLAAIPSTELLVCAPIPLVLLSHQPSQMKLLTSVLVT
jgi:hypothetical protein